MTKLRIKRVYEPAAPEDGMRVLVDRIWPRGLTKEDAALDLWMKEVAPSNELRKWYAHREERWPEFEKRYREELKGREAELEELTGLMRKGPVTLLYAARDGERSNAMVLQHVLARRQPKQS